MTILGITGSYGAGKSVVASMFVALGARCIDADLIVHQIYSEKGAVYRKIKKIFGDDLVNNGKIDRKRLSEIIFSEQKKRIQIEKIVHSEALKRVQKLLREYKRQKIKVVALDVPLLFEAGWDRLTDVNIVVYCPQNQQVERLRKKTSLRKVEIVRRIRAQMPFIEKKARAQFVVNNTGGIRATRQQVQQIWEQITE